MAAAALGCACGEASRELERAQLGSRVNRLGVVIGDFNGGADGSGNGAHLSSVVGEGLEA